MGLPIMENLSGLQESIFSDLEATNSILIKNQKNDRSLLNYPHYPYQPTLSQWLFGVPWAAVIQKHLAESVLISADSLRVLDQLL